MNTGIVVGFSVVLALAGCSGSEPSSATNPAADQTVSSLATSTTTTAASVTSTTGTSTTGTSMTGTSTTGASTTAASVVEPALIGFETASQIEGWSTVNDPVMGGISTSSVAWRDGSLVFSGELSVENNGGFVSLVAPADAVPDDAWVGRDGIRIAGSGDGKTYLVQLRVGGGSYVQRFVAGASFSEMLRFEDFIATSRFLDPLPEAPQLDVAEIAGLAVYLVDGQVGTFELELVAFD